MSYHGTTYGAMSISGIDSEITTEYEPKLEGCVWINSPMDNMTSGLEWIKKIDICIDNNSEVLAAIIVEPVIGSGGIIEIPKEALHHLRKRCIEEDIILVFDEVATGFGRTGSLFTFTESQIYPDIVCLSKGINNGVIPFGAVLINEKIEKVYSKNNEGVEHFSTQNGNPIACATALAMLEILKDENIYKDIKEKGDYFTTKLKENIVVKNGKVDVRNKGLMIGIEITNSQQGYIERSAIEKARYICRKRGLIVYAFYNEGKNAGLSLFPPFIITKDEIDLAVKKISLIMKKVF